MCSRADDPTQHDSPWLTPTEVARLIGFTDITVKRIKPSQLPYMRFGVRGDRRYRREDVDAFIEARMQR